MRWRSIGDDTGSVVVVFMAKTLNRQSPGGAIENSPAFQRRVRRAKKNQVPAGRPKHSAAPAGLEKIIVN
jgi:hypothetical protein